MESESNNLTGVTFTPEQFAEAERLADYGLNDYQEDTDITAIYPNAGTGSDDAITYALFGLLGEAGELANKWKKHLRGDDLTGDSVDYRNNYNKRIAEMRSELGDVLWYAARAAREFDSEFAEIADQNIQKLIKRRDDGKLKGDGDAR